MLTTLLVLALANTLSPDQIASAIAEGVRLKDKPGDIGQKFDSRLGSFLVVLYGPQNRISAAAAFAANRYEPFGPESVTEAMSAPVLSVHAIPRRPEIYGGSYRIAPLAINAVILVNGQPLQPISLKTVPVSWANAMGGTWEGQGLEARFDWAALPAGELEVVIITHNGERHARTVKAKDRAKIR